MMVNIIENKLPTNMGWRVVQLFYLFMISEWLSRVQVTCNVSSKSIIAVVVNTPVTVYIMTAV